MKVLVTGHHGYIGSVLAPLLQEAGHDVVGLDTFFYRDCDFGPEVGTVPSLVADIRDVTPSQLEGFDAIVHLAALSNDPLGDFAPELTYDINLGGTLAIARAAREAGVRRFIFASSCSMYGASDSDVLLDESAPLRPLTPYAESKVRAEEGLAEIASADFIVVSMRNATVYGSSPRLRLDIVLNNLAAWAHTTGQIRLLSDGSSWRPMLHVRDLTRVAGELLTAPEDLIRDQAFNVGSAAQNYAIRDLANVLAEVTGCETSMASEATNDPRSYRVDFSKLERTFPNLSLAWDAQRGATELMGALEAFGLTTEQFEGDAYIRLRRLKTLIESERIDSELRWVVAT
jgi:nucleoside-diphosphate-sugar epimerase